MAVEADNGKPKLVQIKITGSDYDTNFKVYLDKNLEVALQEALKNVSKEPVLRLQKRGRMKALTSCFGGCHQNVCDRPNCSARRRPKFPFFTMFSPCCFLQRRGNDSPCPCPVKSQSDVAVTGQKPCKPRKSSSRSSLFSCCRKSSKCIMTDYSPEFERFANDAECTCVSCPKRGGQSQAVYHVAYENNLRAGTSSRLIRDVTNEIQKLIERKREDITVTRASSNHLILSVDDLDDEEKKQEPDVCNVEGLRDISILKVSSTALPLEKPGKTLILNSSLREPEETGKNCSSKLLQLLAKSALISFLFKKTKELLQSEGETRKKSNEKKLSNMLNIFCDTFNASSSKDQANSRVSTKHKHKKRHKRKKPKKLSKPRSPTVPTIPSRQTTTTIIRKKTCYSLNQSLRVTHIDLNNRIDIGRTMLRSYSSEPSVLRNVNFQVVCSAGIVSKPLNAGRIGDGLSSFELFHCSGDETRLGRRRSQERNQNVVNSVLAMAELITGESIPQNGMN